MGWPTRGQGRGRGSTHPRLTGRSQPNTYEAPSCQETKLLRADFFAFFSAFEFLALSAAVSCFDLLSV